MSKYMRKLTPSEMKLVTGGKRPSAGQGIADFISWAACGFHHRYALTGKTKEAAQLTDKQTERLQALEAARVSGFSDANIWKMDTVEAIGKNQFGYNPAQVRRVLMKFMNKDPRFEDLDVTVMVSMVNQYLEKYPDSKVKRAAGE